MPPKKKKRKVAFACTIDPEAKEVFLVGDFNDWRLRADRMVKRQGAFRKSKELAPGEYQYKFVVDGEWHTDPSADKQVPNDVGSQNSVIEVREAPKR